MLNRLGDLALRIFVAAFVIGAVPLWLAMDDVHHYWNLNQSVPPSAWMHVYVAAGIMFSGPIVFVTWAAFCFVAWLAMPLYELIWRR